METFCMLIWGIIWSLGASILLLTRSGRNRLWKWQLSAAKAGRKRLMSQTSDYWIMKKERPKSWDDQRIIEGIFTSSIFLIVVLLGLVFYIIPMFG
jgi:hypothetical protein